MCGVNALEMWGAQGALTKITQGAALTNEWSNSSRFMVVSSPRQVRRGDVRGMPLVHHHDFVSDLPPRHRFGMKKFHGVLKFLRRDQVISTKQVRRCCFPVIFHAGAPKRAGLCCVLTLVGQQRERSQGGGGSPEIFANDLPYQ